MRSRFVAPSNSQEALGGRAKAPQAPPAEASVTVIVRNAQGLGLSLLQVRLVVTCSLWCHASCMWAVVPRPCSEHPPCEAPCLRVRR